MARKHLQRGPETSVSKDRAMDPAGQFSQFIDRGLQLIARVGQDPVGPGRVVLKLQAGEPECQRE